MLIPTDSMVMANDRRTVTLTLSFSHPFEMLGMELAKPRSFAVVVDGKTRDLLDKLEETRVMGQTGWEVAYPIKRPGIYLFYMELEPYWEAAEDNYIIHYTKTVVTAFGDDEG
jgi:cobalt/nickel transport protein